MIRYVVGITGGSGAGKTTLIRHLYGEFPDQVSTFSLDNYYLPKSQQRTDENGEINFDLPTALDIPAMELDLKRLLSGETVQHKQYAFNHPDATTPDVIIEPRNLLVIEGIFTLYYPFIRDKLNYSVFIEVNEEEQLQRRLKRDLEERNYTHDQIMYQWENHVKPAYRQFVLPYRREADLVLNNERGFEYDLSELLNVIHQNIDSTEGSSSRRETNGGSSSSGQ